MADEPIGPPAGDPPAGDPPAPPAGDPPSDPPAGAPPSDPPATDWRVDLAGEDKELLGFLGRYHSKDAALKAIKKQHDDIRSGKYRKPLGDDPSDDEMAAYRKDFGVPEKPEGYLEKLPDGLVVGDDDKPAVGKFLEKMHGANAPKGVADAALSAYYEIVDEQLAAVSEATAQAKRSCEDELRTEWGADYRRNDNVLQNFVGSLPEPVRDAFDKGTGPDGIPLGFNPEVRRWLVGLALAENPLATLVPGAGANAGQSINDEIASIEKVMRTNRSEYNRDTKMQERLRDLYTARDKMKAA